MTRARVIRMIHGHTHRPGVHDFDVEAQSARRLVLSDWYSSGEVLAAERDAMRRSPLGGS